jgi:hypothetical protein
MSERIIYQNDDGGVAIITPSSGRDPNQVARKDVPTGLPYKIVPASDIPTDRTLRDQWTVDIADLTDGVGA